VFHGSLLPVARKKEEKRIEEERKRKKRKRTTLNGSGETNGIGHSDGACSFFAHVAYAFYQ
jgi:hypothetical protein